jgi:hypothetical protein
VGDGSSSGGDGNRKEAGLSQQLLRIILLFPCHLPSSLKIDTEASRSGGKKRSVVDICHERN